jgi:hypothetical protein
LLQRLATAEISVRVAAATIAQAPEHPLTLHAVDSLLEEGEQALDRLSHAEHDEDAACSLTTQLFGA